MGNCQLGFGDIRTDGHTPATVSAVTETIGSRVDYAVQSMDYGLLASIRFALNVCDPSSIFFLLCTEENRIVCHILA